METLSDWESVYENTVVCHKRIVDTFTRLVTADKQLNAHRSLVEKEVYGFGDRSFHWMWKLIVDTLSDDFTFVEIGVYKGQVISLIKLLANLRCVNANIYGITPLSSFSGYSGKFTNFPDTDYRQHIINLHNLFDLQFDADRQLIVGDSNDSGVIEHAHELGKIDVLYIDGCHEYDYVVRDIINYTDMVKPGGYLVIDDSASFLNMPHGYFNGIEDVSFAVKDTIEKDRSWKPVITVMHNRVFRKV